MHPKISILLGRKGKEKGNRVEEKEGRRKKGSKREMKMSTTVYLYRYMFAHTWRKTESIFAYGRYVNSPTRMFIF